MIVEGFPPPPEISTYITKLSIDNDLIPETKNFLLLSMELESTPELFPMQRDWHSVQKILAQSS